MRPALERHQQIAVARDLPVHRAIRRQVQPIGPDGAQCDLGRQTHRQRVQAVLHQRRQRRVERDRPGAQHAGGDRNDAGREPSACRASVSTATCPPAPPQRTRVTGVLRRMSSPTPSRRCTKAPMPPCGTRLMPPRTFRFQSSRLILGRRRPRRSPSLPSFPPSPPRGRPAAAGHLANATSGMPGCISRSAAASNRGQASA